MKNLTATILIIFSQMILFGQCPPGDLMFTSQSQINDFGTYYPNCHEFDGSIIITGSGFTSLSGLSGLTSIAGDLSFLYVSGLSNLTGLENLTEIGGSLIILECYTLVNTLGMPVLSSVGGEVTIHNNTSLQRVNAFDSLAYVGGDFYISNHGSLNAISGLNRLSTINGKFIMENNPGLGDISGLGNLTNVAGDFRLEDSDVISDLTGLENLGEIGGKCIISFNSNLVDISALYNLNAIGGDLNIRSNYALESLTGLDNIEPASIEDLTIYSNTSLTTCEVLSICEYLLSPGGSVTIDNNASGCDSQQEVEQACEWVSVGEIEAIDRIEIYPNPASSHLHIKLAVDPIQHTQLTITNLSGQEVLKLELTETATELDINSLQSGIYFLRVQGNSGITTQKLVVN